MSPTDFHLLPPRELTPQPHSQGYHAAGVGFIERRVRRRTKEVGAARAWDIHTFVVFDESPSNSSPNIISDRQMLHSVAETFHEC